jgi:predicted peroxiredoxin
MDIEAKIYFLGQALRILKPGVAEKIKVGNFPSLHEMMKKTIEMGIPIMVCEASKQMLGWDKVELDSDLKIVGAATLNDLVLEADATQWF